MNYLKVYCLLIRKRKEELITENFHRHHILPKSIFPEFMNDKDNIVKLTYKEHYVAHHLLYMYYKSIGDINKTYKMANAFSRMCKSAKGLIVSLNKYKLAIEASKKYSYYNTKCKKVLCVLTAITYFSAHEAARKTGFIRSNICACCRGVKGHKTVHGYHWKYVD